MRKNDPISKVSTKNVISVQEGQSVSDVRRSMIENNIHHIPIVRGKKLIGMISFTDMMKLNLVISGADERSIDAIIDQQFSIEDIMSTDLKTANSKSTIREVAELLSNNSFHSIPLVDDNGDLAGIVTSTDLIQYLFEQY